MTKNQVSIKTACAQRKREMAKKINGLKNKISRGREMCGEGIATYRTSDPGGPLLHVVVALGCGRILRHRGLLERLELAQQSLVYTSHGF